MRARLEAVERRQEELLASLGQLRSEMAAGLSSGQARRDSLFLQAGGARRDSQVVGGTATGRRDSLPPSPLALVGTGRRDSLVDRRDSLPCLPVLEAEPWHLPPAVDANVARLLERQFLLSPWLREKRLRNQLRLLLKEHLQAGPVRRSTVTKLVHDAHQQFGVWRRDVREAMLENWDRTELLEPRQAATVIFSQFSRPRQQDEADSVVLYAEHMVEVAQFLKRKAGEKRSGKSCQAAITNSKFWYEVRKKISEVVQQDKSEAPGEDQNNADESEDNDAKHTSVDSDEERCNGSQNDGN